MNEVLSLVQEKGAMIVARNEAHNNNLDNYLESRIREIDRQVFILIDSLDVEEKRNLKTVLQERKEQLDIEIRSSYKRINSITTNNVSLVEKEEKIKELRAQRENIKIFKQISFVYDSFIHYLIVPAKDSTPGKK